MLDFITENAVALVIAVLALAKVVVNLTPTEKDNKVFGYLDLLINAMIPDRIKAKKMQGTAETQTVQAPTAKKKKK
jgi:hypothetical protein